MKAVFIGLNSEQIKRATLIVTTCLLLPGCDNFISDSVWTQEDTVTIGSSNFEECLSTAFSDFPNVRIDRTRSQPGDIVLNVTLERPIPSLGVYVRHLEGNKVKVLFTGKGEHETDQNRAMITPVLATITYRLHEVCP